MPPHIGLIVEYNPFHNGHLHHLREAARALPGAPLICVMSGHWVQRGEPAAFNKWARTRMALEGGADLVLELPLVFALQSADRFAFGAVRTLAGTGLVSHLCFGSELGAIEPLQRVAALLAKEPPPFKALLKEALAEGCSYPTALSRACSGCFAGEEGLAGIVQSPNNILGIEYLKNLMKIPAPITPFTILRKGAGYHSLDLSEEIASASAIRRGLQAGDDRVFRALPPASRQLISAEIEAGRGPLFPGALTLPMLTLLRRASLAELADLPDMEPGLAERFLKTGRSAATLEEVLALTSTRRYTLSRLQRILCYLYLGINRRDLQSFNRSGPRYLRILGFSPRGREALNAMKKKAKLPLLTRPARYLRHSRDARGRKMLAFDLKGSDLYCLLYPEPAHRRAGDDYRHPPLQTSPEAPPV